MKVFSHEDVIKFLAEYPEAKPEELIAMAFRKGQFDVLNSMIEGLERDGWKNCAERTHKAAQKLEFGYGLRGALESQPVKPKPNRKKKKEA